MTTTINLDMEYWVTQDGRKLYPSDMESSHLTNTIAFLQRNVDDLKASEDLKMSAYDTSSLGEAAQDAADRELEIFWNLDPEEWMKDQKIYQLLVEECKKRELTVPDVFGDLHPADVMNRSTGE